MITRTYIYTTCTNQKRVKPRPECCLDAHLASTPESSFSSWKQALAATAPQTPAADLYGGSHWQESLGALQAARSKGFTADLNVLSAGLGLCNVSEKIPSYSATFSPGKDSVQNLPWPSELDARARAKHWWQFLSKDCSAFPPLSDSEQVDTLHLFILSPGYFQAIESDLVKMVSRSVPTLVVSAGVYAGRKSAHPILRDFIVPVSEKIKQVDPTLNRPNVALNARVANWLIQEHAERVRGGVAQVMAFMQSFEDTLPPLPRKAVVRMTDEEVLSFIKEHYSEALNSATRLLRHLRDDLHLSCEQKRFGALFQQYKDQSEGGTLFDVEDLSG